MEVKAGDSDAVVVVKQRLLEGPSDAVVAVDVDMTVDVTASLSSGEVT